MKKLFSTLFILFVLLVPVMPEGVISSETVTFTTAHALHGDPHTLQQSEGSGETGLSAQIDGACGISTNFSMAKCAAHAADLALMIGALFLGLAGMIFNFVVTHAVINLGAFAAEDGVKAAWTVLRDVANVGFIFLLVFIGFATILRISGYEYKTLLRNLVLAALFVNFSFFITGFIIDASNLLSLSIYKQLALEEGCETRQECLNDGLAGRYMDQLQLTSIYQTSETGTLGSEAESADGKRLEAGNVFLLGIGGLIFLLVAAFVFAAAAFLLLARAVMLIFLLILSPLAFVAMAMPKLGGHASAWWSSLFKNAFFAPIFLLMALLTLTVMGEVGALFDTAGNEATFAAAIVGGASSIGVIVNFLIIIGFMVASLIIAQKMGAWGGAGAVNVGKRFRGYGTAALGGATFGAAGRLGRTTFGRVSSNLADSRWLKSQAAKGGVRGGVAEGVQRSLRWTGDKSFDVRNAPGAKDAAKQLELGGGIKGGYETTVKDYTKKRTAYAKELGTEKPKGDEREAMEALRRQIAEAQERGDSETAEGYQAMLKDLEGGIKARGRQRQEEYAEDLATRQTGTVVPFIQRRVTNRNRAAADAIRKEIGKSPEEARADALRDAISKIKTDSD